jgi:Tfp pilus assembly protein PilX
MQNRRTRGIALIVTLVFLALFACLAVAIVSSADANLTIAHNRIESQQASALADAGLLMTQKSLGGLNVSGVADATSMHALIANRLRTAFASSTMLDANYIASTADGVIIPTATVAQADNRTGQVDVNIHASGGATDGTTITIQSVGRFGGAQRTVTYNMTVQLGESVLANYGVASKGPIQMTGNARIVGANDPAEGSILSATYSTPQAVRMTGNCTIGGNVDVCNPDGQIVKTGNIHINGSQRIGVAEPEWPEVDISPFTPYATNTYAGNGSGNLTLSNVYIPAGTNPTFSGNVVIYGVLHIESPNKVKFTGNCTVIGVIVADEPAVDSLTNNCVQFTGNVSTSGVGDLPADAQYDGLRELEGSFLLAPGFSTSFTGNFNTVNGCMVASEFKFTGNAGGRIKGGVVNLRDTAMQLTGNANIVIDRQGTPENPAGIVSSTKLVCVSGSYAE